MTLSGALDVQGGTINVGLAGSATDLDYDQTDVGVVPSIEVSSGTLLVYGGINPAAGAGSDPFSFTQSGGTVDLNNGTSRTADEVLGITNVTGSVFTMSDGLIYVRDTNTDADPEFDIGGANASHTVTGGSIYFGSLTNARTFEFVPYSGIQQPNFRIDGSGGSTLRPNACGDFTLLSLHIEGDDYFDVSNGSACSNTMTLTSTYDGTYSLYISNKDRFEHRTGTVYVSGTGTIRTPSHVSQGPFYHLRCSDAGQTVTIEEDMHINGELTLGDGALDVPNGVDLRIAGSTSPVAPINKTTSTTFPGGGWLRLGLVAAQRTYLLAGGDYGSMKIGAAGVTGGFSMTVEQQGDITAQIIAVNGDFTSGRPTSWNTNDHDITLSEHLWVGRGAGATSHQMNLGSSTVNLGRDLWVEGGGVLNMGSANITIGEDLIVNQAGSVDATINAGTSTVSFDESGDWTLISNNNITVELYDLELNRAGSLTLTDADLEVSNNVTFVEGTLITNVDDTFTLGPSATISGAGAGSFVSGPQRKVTNSLDPFTFIVGKNGVVREITITPSSTVSTVWAVEYHDSGAPDIGQPMNGGIQQIMPTEYWDVTRVSGTAGAYFEVSWVNWDVPDPATTVVAHFNGTSWDNLGGTPNGSGMSGSISSTVELITFSPIALASTDAGNILPVEFVRFDGFSQGNGNLLRWTTATELDNDFFLVERSSDGVDFEAIGSVKGSGDSNEELNYDFLDEAHVGIVSYYRLKQVDFDGTHDYSRVIRVEPIETSFGVYPNPTSDVAWVQLPYTGDWSVELLDVDGRVLTQSTILESRHEIDLREFDKGLYFIRLREGHWTNTRTIIKR